MANDGGSGVGAVASDPDLAGITAIVERMMAALPTGCSWMLPMFGADGDVVDFTVAATSGDGEDIYGRGVTRVGHRLSELYPEMFSSALWRMLRGAYISGVPDRLIDYRYEERRPGVIAESRFDFGAQRVLGGLVIWYRRLDEAQRRLDRTEQLGSLGWAEYDLTTGLTDWSSGMYRIFERDPALGPMSLDEQRALQVRDDRDLSEATWQILDSGATSDMTVRFRTGATVKHLRILCDVARDAAGNPLKVYAVVQDVTAREDSRTAIERLRDQLSVREMTALAEHRLAVQLQNMIQPVPREPFPLNGLEAVVSYLPAESAMRVGGDWYHAQDLPDGLVALAIGDVAGHGLDAANGMAHLRFSLVAWLSIGIRNPGTLLSHMNRLCDQLRITATAVVAMYDPADRTLSWARAGHMPPLLARGGSTDEFDRPAGLMLGAHIDAVYSVVRARQQVDDLVLFYTDGLIERRTSSNEQMLDQVKQTLSEVSAELDESALARLRGLLHESNPDDDTCALMIRVLAEDHQVAGTG